MTTAALSWRRGFAVSASHEATAAIFSINFVRHQQLPRYVQRSLTWAVCCVLLLHVVVAAGLGGLVYRTHAQGRRLQTQLQGALASADAASTLKQEMLTLRDRAHEDAAQLNAMIALQQTRFPVGARLAGLTKTLPPRTWITGLAADRDKRTLTIHASYLIDAERPFELPTKAWMAALQADPQFSRGLKRLELGESSRKLQGAAELFCFGLVAEWKP